jgi:hypothetical protein
MHDHEITSLSTQLNNTTQNGGFVDIWGKSAGSRWRRCFLGARHVKTGRRNFTSQRLELWRYVINTWITWQDCAFTACKAHQTSGNPLSIIQPLGFEKDFSIHLGFPPPFPVRTIPVWQRATDDHLRCHLPATPEDA